MDGARALMRTLAESAIDTLFTNPGTTELHLVEAAEATPGLRSVLALFEGTVSGAADGFGRIAGRPAATLLHLGPGQGNGWANFHNARRARTPIVSVIGDDRRAGCAIRFRTESNDALAQRIDNPLFVGPADAPCTQGRDRLRMAKGHRDAVKFRDAATPRQCVERTRDIRRHNWRSAAQQQLPDTGQKALETSVGRAPALRKPDLHIACLKHPRSGFETRSGMLRIHWEQMCGPRDHASERIKE